MHADIAPIFTRYWALRNEKNNKIGRVWNVKVKNTECQIARLMQWRHVINGEKKKIKNTEQPFRAFYFSASPKINLLKIGLAV